MNGSRRRALGWHADCLQLLLALVMTAVLLLGCSDDGGGSGDGDSSRRTSTSVSEPPASDEEEAFPLVEHLVLEATALVDDLFQDPSKVEDPDDPDITRLRELYTADSPTPDGVVEQLERMASEGLSDRAARSGVFRDLGVYQMAAVDDDTIRFRVCATEDIETVDASGTVVERRAQVTQGAGEARRINGKWRFYGIHPDEGRTLDIEPGTASPGFCDQLYAGQEVAS